MQITALGYLSYLPRLGFAVSDPRRSAYHFLRFQIVHAMSTESTIPKSSTALAIDLALSGTSVPTDNNPRSIKVAAKSHPTHDTKVCTTMAAPHKNAEQAEDGDPSLTAVRFSISLIVLGVCGVLPRGRHFLIVRPTRSATRHDGKGSNTPSAALAMAPRCRHWYLVRHLWHRDSILAASHGGWL